MKKRKTKQIILGLDARKRLLRGAQALSKAVTVTYGPHGRTALLDRFAGLLSTKDGATVAKEIVLPDPVENLGSRILRDACDTVNEKVGDGTTTTALVAEALLRAGHKVIVAGASPKAVARGIQEAAEVAIEAVKAASLPVETQEDLERVAYIACNGDAEIASQLAEGCMAVGKDGTLIIEDGQAVETHLEFKEGMEIDRGMASVALFHDPEFRETIEGALVAIINAPIRAFADIRSLFESAVQFPRNPLILIAPEIEGEAMMGFTLNSRAGRVSCAAVLAPGVGHWKPEYLKDIAALSKATFVDPAAGMNFREWQGEWFGSLRKAVITPKTSTMEAYPDAHEGVQARIAVLKAEKEASTSDFDRDRLTERIAKLSGGLAILKVGGVTEAALRERKGRIEDALGAVRASLRGGIVPGGGVAYLIGSESIKVFVEDTTPWEPDERAGWMALSYALRQPTVRLAGLAGQAGEKVAHDVLETQNTATGDRHGWAWLGWDASTGQIRDVREDPCICDPTEVVIEVIRAATSVASTLLTTEGSITPKEAQ